jgi:hypothetical protein
MDNELSDTVLSEALKGVVTVTFTKKDNTVRVMRCTTNLGIIPSDKHPTSTAPINNEVSRVYDLDIGEWRSFRKSSLINIKMGT